VGSTGRHRESSSHGWRAGAERTAKDKGHGVSGDDMQEQDSSGPRPGVHRRALAPSVFGAALDLEDVEVCDNLLHFRDTSLQSGFLMADDDVVCAASFAPQLLGFVFFSFLSNLSVFFKASLFFYRSSLS
jgi:hypothetical protein